MEPNLNDLFSKAEFLKGQYETPIIHNIFK